MVFKKTCEFRYVVKINKVAVIQLQPEWPPGFRRLIAPSVRADRGCPNVL
jgi:hypothetical protein